MLPIHTILHATDFSEFSRSATHLACALARDYNTRLVVVHVVAQPTVVYAEGVVPPDPELFLEAGREQLNHLDLPEHAERRLEEGDAVEVILRAADDVQADLIVMGTHGRTGLERLLMGSVAEHVLRKAPCPVLTVRTPFPWRMGANDVEAEAALAAS